MSRRAAVVVAMALAPFAAVLACSDPPSKPEPAVGGKPIMGGGGGGGPDGGSDVANDSDGGVCNDIMSTAVVIDKTGLQGDPPMPTGGIIADGFYDLTDYSVYVGLSGIAGPTGITARASIRIANGRIDEVLELGGVGKTSSITRTSGTFGATGSTFVETITCGPVLGGKQVQYTSTNASLLLVDLTTKEAFTFTLR